jgi:hypothetical protein
MVAVPDDEGFLGKARVSARVCSGSEATSERGKTSIRYHGIRAVACAAVSVAESLAAIAASLASLDRDGIETYETDGDGRRKGI